ncbi:unnamed protein product [Prunus armeniaca]
MGISDTCTFPMVQQVDVSNRPKSFHSYDFSLTLIWISVAGFLSTSLWQIKKRKLKDDKKRKEIEVQKAKEEQLSKKCQREERRERYQEQDKLKKKNQEKCRGLMDAQTFANCFRGLRKLGQCAAGKENAVDTLGFDTLSET